MARSTRSGYYVPALGGFYASLDQYAATMLRVVMGAMLIPHGMQKLFGSLGGPGMARMAAIMDQIGYHPGTLWAWLIALTEFVGGILLILGLFTRPVAFILAGDMAVAYFMAHAPRGFFPISMGGNGGELAIMFCFVFLYLMVAGAGAWSVDATREPWRSKY